MVSIENVKDSYFWLLNRLPESEGVVDKHMARFASGEALRVALLNSKEFCLSHPLVIDDHPSKFPARQREPIVFLHIPKCAGSTFHGALVEAVDERLFPERHNGLNNWPAKLINHFSLFSGHFDYSSLALLGTRTKTVTFLRQPEERLISMYRFLRAHKVDFINKSPFNLGLCRLAQTKDPIGFFKHPELQNHPTIDNAMVRQMVESIPQRRWEAFYPGYSYPKTAFDKDPKKATYQACENLKNMTAFGLVEYFDVSLTVIFHALSLDAPEKIEKQQVMELLPNKNPFVEAVDPVEQSPELMEAMAPLIEFDLKLYEFAEDLLRIRDTI